MSSEKFIGFTHKYRSTNQRHVILEVIKESRSHPTANEIYETVRKRLPNISLGTIYRNIEILYENGLIEKIGPITNQMRYDGITENHYHIRCIRCGKIVDAPMRAMNGLDDYVQRRTDYTILGHRLEYVGICPDCKKKEDQMHALEGRKKLTDEDV